jgi:trigger factor
MQVSIETLSPVEKKLAVEIPWLTVRDKLDAAYKELSRGVKVKGFRPGKVPRPVLERIYGRQVAADVARSLVQESFVSAAREHKLEPVAEPVVEDAAIKPNEPFRYSARVEIRGDVKVGTLDGLAGTRRKVSVEDAEVDSSLEHLRREHTDYLPIEGRTNATDTDVVIISLKGTIGDRKIDKSDMPVDLSDPAHDPLPGLIEALKGIPFDAKDAPLKLSFAEDHEIKEIAGKTAELTVTVKDARQKQVPALDDEFAKDTGEAETLAALKDKLKDKLLERKKAEAERETRAGLLKAFVAANQIPVAPALVERGIDAQLERARMSFAMQGLDMDKTGVDVRSLREKLREQALEEVRGQLLLDALADDQKLEISDAEIDAKVLELAEQRKKRPGQLKAEMNRDGSLDSLRWRLRQEKALDQVVARATITETDAPAAPGEDESQTK